MTALSGADALCNALAAAGVDCVFGLPGTQTVVLYEALRRSRLNAVVATHELAAAFMANGYARASGKPGVLLTIPGPGFAYAVAGLAEAKLDGAAVVHLTLEPARGPSGDPAFQAIDQAGIARPLVKAVIPAKDRPTLPAAVEEAMFIALQSEPGPVLVEMCERALMDSADDSAKFTAPGVAAAASGMEHVIAQIAAAKQPVLFVARDCNGAEPLLAAVAEQGRVPVCVPAPNRGVLAEDHPWCLCFDDQRTQFDTLQAAIARSDLIVVIGTRLNHVTTAGFRLKLPADRVICVAPRGGALPHGYQASRTIEAEPGEFLRAVAGAAAQFASAWSADDVQSIRDRLSTTRPINPPEPTVDGGPAEKFFSAAREALPRDTIVVTDSGLHQVMVRRYLPVLAPNGLIIPSELQSMGFGLPAGIGAKLAAPARPVVVVMGDGGFAMSGMEMLTAVREKIPVVVVVFNDGKLNLIRVQQLREFGAEHGVRLQGPDLEQFALAVGVRYRKVSGDAAAVLREAVGLEEPTLVEVIVGDSAEIRRMHMKSAVRETVRRALGPRLVNWIKQLRG